MGHGSTPSFVFQVLVYRLVGALQYTISSAGMGKKLNLPFPLDVQKLKGFQLQGAKPPDSLTRGSALGPRSAPRPPL